MKTLYAIKTEIGDVLHIGSKAECEIVHQSFIRYGIRSDKLYIECVQDEFNYGLTTEEINKIEDAVYESFVSGSYGEEQLRDMFDSEIGNMTLQELIDQCEYAYESIKHIVEKYKTNQAFKKEVL